jgi:heterodisulfide reductase subunit A-like polyferredoxin
VATDGHGFVGLKGAAALPDLQRDGIFAVGACESPTDIAGCLAQAEAVSAAVLGCPR